MIATNLYNYFVLLEMFESILNFRVIFYISFFNVGQLIYPGLVVVAFVAELSLVVAGAQAPQVVGRRLDPCTNEKPIQGPFQSLGHI